MRLAKRLAFLCFDNSSGIIKGEQPLIRASRASKVAGAFLVLFWHAKENLTPRNRALLPLHQREIPLKENLALLQQQSAPAREPFLVLFWCTKRTSLYEKSIEEK